VIAGSPLDSADPLCRLSAAELTELYRSGEASPVDVAQAVLGRAEEVRDRYGAFVFLDERGCLEAARLSERRWRDGAPLGKIDGVPATIKDVAWVKGWTVRYGSLTSADEPCVEDAPAVAGLRVQGAVFIGLTSTPEFGWKAVTDGPGHMLTSNPWDETLTSGGSSGGAAVAAATGAGVLHLGTDGGGSIRIPSAFCGVSGIKPTYGLVPAYPASAFGTLAHVGPIARNIDDLSRMLEAMARRDLRDWTQGATQPFTSIGGEVRIAGKSVGYWADPPCGSVDPQVRRIVEGVVHRIAAAGAQVSPTSLPEGDVLTTFKTLWYAGAAARVSNLAPSAAARLDPGLLEVVAEGRTRTAVDYVAASSARAAFGASMDRLMCDYDFLVSPAVAVPPFVAGLETPSGSGLRRWTEWAGFSFPINLSQQPAAVIPCGLTQEGLPVGLQVIGPRNRDAEVLAVAAEIARLVGEWRVPAPGPFRPQ
jgi:amidase/aspartyl-tRNA(Asn)/glutamyl-tRNA(Gln) amidotransferase subunit A